MRESVCSGGLDLLDRVLKLFVMSYLLAPFLGCQRLQLPAIDPNGQCLFLPFPNTTQLAVPPVHSRPGQPGFLPDPAYTAPAAPSACLDGSCEPGGLCNLFQRRHDCLERIHNHFRSAGKAGQLQLTPMRVVAPVGGEVVLLAGICGQDGYLVKREPLEWMISPDSVGQIIEVNNDSPGTLASLTHPNRPKVEKLDVDYAKGRTSSKAQIIDRGTPECNDDIHLREGETWLSVSSPTPGITRITALAPDSKIWDRRRQTAVIYWLDAQWEFPPPQIVKNDQRVVLRTKVTKADGFVPAAGWLVQYTIADPTIAEFVVSQNVQQIDPHTIRAPVDQNGFAFAELAALPNAFGTTAVTIDVISPAQPAENIPELVVGRGQTFATFSSAGLLLELAGTQQVAVGDQVTLSMTLANPGDIDAENTLLTLQLPDSLQLLNSSQTPSARTNTGFRWDQGILPANRQLDITVLARAAVPGTFDVEVVGEANGVNRVSKSLRIEVYQPSVDVQLQPLGGAAQAEVGQVVPYEILLKNTGRQTLTNLKLKILTDPGLVEAESRLNKVEQTISYIQPEETQRLGIPFLVQQEGQQRVLLQVFAGSNDNAPMIAQRESAINGLAPRPKQPNMAVEISFPTENSQLTNLEAGKLYTALITLRNTGETNLTNLNVEVRVDERLLRFEGIDPANERLYKTGRGYLLWTPGNLLPGNQGDTIRQMRLAIRALEPSPATNIQIQAGSNEGVQAQAASPTFAILQAAIQPGPVTPPVVLPPTNNPSLPPGPNVPNNLDSGLAPLTGKLAISFAAFNDPEQVDREIRYGLIVKNNSNRENQRVQIELGIPEGASVVGVSSQGVETPRTFGANGNLMLQPVNSLRIGESINYVVVLKSRVPQQMRIVATVRSDLFPDPESASYTSTIISAN